jgi:membrane associated rhomboid family serine protease
VLLPIGDDNTHRVRFPIVTIALILVNAYVFWLELKYGDAFVMQYSVVPEYLLTGQQSWFNLISSMFLHGGVAHIFGNMLYLYIFGDNLEDNLGRAKYLLFYLLCGIAAMVAQIAVAPHSTVPSLGASGAIAGVLAGYLILFPRNRVRVLIFFPFSMTVSAWFVLGLWIVTQLISGWTSVFHTEANVQGGVAYMAHIGGFFAGIVLVFLFRNRQAQSGASERLGLKS